MKDIIYLEPDVEITSVIDKIRKSANDVVILVIPRGSALAQSLINLKILKRSTDESGKQIALVTNEKIAKNLAAQIDLPAFDKVADAEKATYTQAVKTVTDDFDGSLNVHTYQKYSGEEEVEEIASPAPELKDEEMAEAGGEIETENAETDPMTDNQSETEPKEDKEDNFAERFTSRRISVPVGEPEEIRPSLPSRPVIRERHKGSNRKVKFIATFLVVIGLITAAALFLFAVRADVAVSIKADDLSKELDVVIESKVKDVDPEQIVVPGELLSVVSETTKQFEATGKKEAGEKAKGKITISNIWDLNDQTIPSGSRFTAAGKSFVSKESVKVPGATITLQQGNPVTSPGKADVSVEAENAGDSYNLGPSDFVITSLSKEKQAKITGKSVSAMTGGTTKQLSVVTEADLTAAASTLKDEMSAQMAKDLIDQTAKDGKKVLDDKLQNEVISMEPSKKADEEASNFDVKMKLKVFTLAFKEDNIRDAVLDSIRQELSSDQMIVNPDKSTITYKVAESDMDLGNAKLSIKFDGKVGKKIEIKKIKESIKGKSSTEAAANLKKIEGIVSSKIEIWPDFIKMIPYLPEKIKVNFEFQE